ncbi:DUF2939 domain-containing protein [Candidatus Venteria ishoeyi]|nr:DUF2939 domain-containing protein [Candidatus Venteria ishoeyi]
MFLFLLAFTAAMVWPFSSIYRIGDALAANDVQTLNKLVDINSIRVRYKAMVDKQAVALKNMAAPQSEMGTFTRFLGNSVQGLNNMAVDRVVTIDWVREQLRPPSNDENYYPSLLLNTSFGFYESPVKFLVRMGELGESPVHYYMQLQDWEWRVTAIYP